MVWNSIMYLTICCITPKTNIMPYCHDVNTRRYVIRKQSNTTKRRLDLRCINLDFFESLKETKSSLIQFLLPFIFFTRTCVFRFSLDIFWGNLLLNIPSVYRRNFQCHRRWNYLVLLMTALLPFQEFVNSRYDNRLQRNGFCCCNDNDLLLCLSVIISLLSHVQINRFFMM